MNNTSLGGGGRSSAPDLFRGRILGGREMISSDKIKSKIRLLVRLHLSCRQIEPKSRYSDGAAYGYLASAKLLGYLLK